MISPDLRPNGANSQGGTTRPAPPNGPQPTKAGGTREAAETVGTPHHSGRGSADTDTRPNAHARAHMQSGRQRRSGRRAHGIDPEGAICVQRLDDSLISAIRTSYRSWPRSSSTCEPRDPPLQVIDIRFASPHLGQGGRGKQGHRRRRGGRESPLPIERPLAPHTRSRPGTHPDGSTPRGTSPAEASTGKAGDRRKTSTRPALMILPQVHLRKPCYDFYFLQTAQFDLPLARPDGTGETRPACDPKTSLSRPIGSSDGRCVQRAGT